MGLNVNYTAFSGNLTADPEVRYTPNGTACCEITIAHNKSKERNSDHTIYMPVAIFGKTAEVCGKTLSNGDQIMVEGELIENKWTTREGQKRSQIKLMANNVHFIYLRSSANKGNNTNYNNTSYQG